jgi:hypothetical protein
MQNRKPAESYQCAAKLVGDETSLKPNAKQPISNMAQDFAHKWTPRYITWMMHAAESCCNCMKYQYREEGKALGIQNAL